MLRRLSFSRSVASLAFGTAIGQGVFVLASPLISRVYDPAELGKFGVLSAFIGFTSVATSLRYESAIIAASSLREAAHLVLGCLGLVVPLSLAAACLLVPFSHYSWFGIQSPTLGAAVLVFALLVLSGMQVILRNWLVRQGQVGTIAKSSAMQGVTRSLGQLLFGVAGFGWLGMAIGDCFGRALPVGWMFGASWSGLRQGFIPFERKKVALALRTYRDFPYFTLPSTVVDTLAANIPLPLIARFYGMEEAGYFALIQRAAGVPLSVLGGSIADIFHARLAERRPSGAVELFLRTATGLAFFGAVPTLILALFGESLFARVFGTRWAEAGQLGALLAPWVFAQFIVSPLSRTVFVFRGQRVKLIYDIISLILTLAVFGISAREGFSFLRLISLLSWSNTFAYLIYFLILLRLCSTPAPVAVCAE